MAGGKDLKMTNEKIITLTTTALEHLKQGANGNVAELLNTLKEEAAAEIRKAAAKASGNGNRQKAAERVIKNAKKTQPFKEALHGAWINESGKQCICDSFRGFMLNEALPLETIPENLQAIDLKRVIDGASKNEGAQLALPDVHTLKAYIKTEKARKKATKDKNAVIWDFGDGLPAVNAEFLLDTLEILPQAEAIGSRRRPLLDVIYFKSSNGCGVLCPVRVK